MDREIIETSLRHLNLPRAMIAGLLRELVGQETTMNLRGTVTAPIPFDRGVNRGYGDTLRVQGHYKLCIVYGFTQMEQSGTGL